MDTKANPIPVTPWSSVHFGVGYIFAGLTEQFGFQKSLLVFLVLHTLYETKDVLFTKCSLINSIFDELIALLGFLVYYQIRSKQSLPIVFALVLLYMTSPLSSTDGKWTLNLWKNRH